MVLPALSETLRLPFTNAAKIDPPNMFSSITVPQKKFNDSLSVTYSATHTGKGKKPSSSVFYWVIKKKFSEVCTPKIKEFQKKQNFNAIIFPDSHGFLTLTQGHKGSLANCYHSTKDTWPSVYWCTPIPKRKATSQKLHFFWGRVYCWLYILLNEVVKHVMILQMHE